MMSSCPVEDNPAYGVSSDCYLNSNYYDSVCVHMSRDELSKPPPQSQDKKCQPPTRSLSGVLSRKKCAPPLVAMVVMLVATMAVSLTALVLGIAALASTHTQGGRLAQGDGDSYLNCTEETTNCAIELAASSVMYSKGCTTPGLVMDISVSQLLMLSSSSSSSPQQVHSMFCTKAC